MVKRAENGPLLVLVALAASVLLAVQAHKPVPVSSDGSYTKTMQEEVRKIVVANRYNASGFIRLVFHDCFVKGCDGSVLLTDTPYKGKDGKTEKDSPANIGLRGLEAIQEIKDRLAVYDSRVTCADAIVYAAREATYILSNYKIEYYVDGPGSHRDSVVSSADNVKLPGPSDKFKDLVRSFRLKDFSEEDLVVLSGAHAIGQAHYTSFKDRVSQGPVTAGEIDAVYAAKVGEKALADGILKSPNPTVHNNVRDLDQPEAYPGVLDNSYYKANLDKKVLFNSDWELTQNKKALADLVDYSEDAGKWNVLFADAMSRLSKLTNMDGDGRYEKVARTKCTAINR